MIFLNYTARGVIIASMITIHLEDLQIYSEVFLKEFNREATQDEVI